MKFCRNLNNNNGISVVTLIITVIVIIILASIVIYMGLQVPDRANFAKFVSNFSDFQTAIQNDFSNRQLQYAKNDETRSKSQIYYTIASGFDMGINMPTAPKGFVSELGEILPNGLDGDEYYVITTDTNIEGWDSHKQYYSTIEQHFVTDAGVAFFLPGYLVRENGKQKWYINEKSYYVGDPMLPSGDMPIPYIPLKTKFEVINEENNIYNISITNENTYEVTYRIKDRDDIFNITSNSTNLGIQTIAANDTQTFQISISSRQDIIYENTLRDERGNVYMVLNIDLELQNPHKGRTRLITSGIIFYLEKNIKNTIIASEDEIIHYEEGFVFKGISKETEADLCAIIDPVSNEQIYFFRGNIENNYVQFADKIWRILRINSDGSLRLILDSVISISSYKSKNVPSKYNIDTAIEHIKWKDSLVYKSLHEWYNANLSSYDDYVVTTKYVFDTSYEKMTSSATSDEVYYFGPYLRVGIDGNKYQPTFSYTDDSLIEDKIGLITADEALYAGAYWNAKNTKFFLYNSNITTGFWTMSPSFWDNAVHYKVGMLVLDADGHINDWPNKGDTLTGKLGIRPVISIRGDLEMAGNGTKENPYKYKK